METARASAGTLPLGYQPLLTRYSRSQSKLVIVSTTPNELHLVNPANGTDISVALPAPTKALSISEGGLLASVLDEGRVSLIDIPNATVVRTSSTGGSHTEVFTANSGILAFTGQTGGQWVTPPFAAISLVFKGAGTYIHSADLNYVGNLGVPAVFGGLMLSHSPFIREDCRLSPLGRRPSLWGCAG